MTTAPTKPAIPAQRVSPDSPAVPSPVTGSRSLPWAIGEIAASVGVALLFLLWSQNIDVDPLSRRGQVSGLAALQFRFAAVSIVLVVALVLAHRFLPPARRRRVVALGCAVVAGLTTGLVAGGISVALRGTQWGLWAGGGDYGWILQWIGRLDRGEPIPHHYPPAIFAFIRGWAHLSGQPAAYAVKEVQLVGTALFGPAAYLAWRLVLRPVWALGIGVVAMLPFIEPVKPYPQITLVMLLPVLVCYLSVVRRGAGRTLRAAAVLGVAFGVGIGLLFMLYSGWFVWGAPGVAVAFLLVAPWRTALRQTLVLVGTTLVAFVAVTWWHLTGLLSPSGGTSDNFFYFDTNTEPTYFAMWRNDRPGDVGTVWPPLGELGGVGLFTILLAVGLGVAIWLGWRRTAVITLGLAAVSAWMLRMWLASEQWATQTVRLYPRTTMILLYCTLLLTGLAVMYATDAARRRWLTQPGAAEPDHGTDDRRGGQRAGLRAAPFGLLLIPLLFVLASAGSATANHYMPVSARNHPGYYAYYAQVKPFLNGGCSKYGRTHGCHQSNPPGVPSDSIGPVPPVIPPVVAPKPSSAAPSPSVTPSPSVAPSPSRSAR
jgi:galactan 5-O-arabinofuranosyltransferase